VNPSYDFTGQVALVTGSSSGMGLATAQVFAQAGAAVVLADINHDTLRTATDDLTAASHQALGVTCDVSSEDDVAAMVRAARVLADKVAGSLDDPGDAQPRAFGDLEHEALALTVCSRHRRSWIVC
jgi:NAD(P)-dependent dehydrogenase (short-subunit alcohol dehydrogenase family)